MKFCILSYNHPEVTARTVRQALTMASEVLLVHNGSLPEHVEALKKQFPQVDHRILPRNLGYSGGANFALRCGFETADWVVFTSNDCEVLNLGNLPKEPSLVAPLIYKRKTTFVDSIGGGFSPSTARLVHFKNRTDFELAEQGRSKWLAYVPGSAFVVHKEVFEATSGFDTVLGTYWDDVDWSLRVKQAGFKIQLDTDWKFLHRVGKTCHKNSLYSIYYFQRNRKKISWKYCRGIQKPRLASHLTFDWLKLSRKLIASGRKEDLKHLKNALFN